MKKLLFALALVGTLTLSASAGAEGRPRGVEMDCVAQDGELVARIAFLGIYNMSAAIEYCRSIGGHHITNVRPVRP